MAERFCPNSSCNSRASTRRSSLRISSRRRVRTARSSVACARRSPRSPTACPIMASSIDRKRGSGVRYWPCAMRCSAATICCAGASVCAIASEAKKAMASAISSATWMLSTMCCQASDIAASGSAMAETVPAVSLRVLIDAGDRRVAAKQRLHGRGEPAAAATLADPLALAAERLLERAHRLEPDADSRRNQLHRLDGAPIRTPARDVRAFCCCATATRASTALPAPARPVLRMRRWPDRRCDRRRWWPRRSRLPDTRRRRRAGGRRVEARGACDHSTACR